MELGEYELIIWNKESDCPIALVEVKCSHKDSTINDAKKQILNFQKETRKGFKNELIVHFGTKETLSGSSMNQIEQFFILTSSRTEEDFGRTEKIQNKPNIDLLRLRITTKEANFIFSELKERN